MMDQARTEHLVARKTEKFGSIVKKRIPRGAYFEDYL